MREEIQVDEVKAEEEAAPRPVVESYDYQTMFEMLKDGRAEKVCRQKDKISRPWIVAVGEHFYREIYDTKTWKVRYDLMSQDEKAEVLMLFV